MYNNLFGMPNRRNISYNNAYNKNPRPNPSPPQNHSDGQDTEKKHKNKQIVSTTNRNFIKSSALGGMVIPGGTNQGTTYNINTIRLNTCAYKNFSILFNFSCNITCNITCNIAAKTATYLRFQLLKQENYPDALIPVSSSFCYAKDTDSDLVKTDTFSFTAYDRDSAKCKHCNYSIFVEIMVTDTPNNIMITNPILIASIIENNNYIKKGEDHDKENKKKI